MAPVEDDVRVEEPDRSLLPRELDAEDFEVSEKCPVLTRRRPREPSAQEIDEHNATHEPYLHWCISCVIGRGRVDQHRQSNRDDVMPVIGVDYGFLRHIPLSISERSGGSREQSGEPEERMTWLRRTLMTWMSNRQDQSFQIQRCVVVARLIVGFSLTSWRPKGTLLQRQCSC